MIVAPRKKPSYSPLLDTALPLLKECCIETACEGLHYNYYRDLPRVRPELVSCDTIYSLIYKGYNASIDFVRHG